MDPGETRMVVDVFSLNENYWAEFEVDDEDIEFLYAHLLEKEEPLTPQQLAQALIPVRLSRALTRAEKQRNEGGAPYLPKNDAGIGDRLVFQSMDGQVGDVIAERVGKSFDPVTFKVVKVKFESGEEKEFAANYPDHALNEPPAIDDDDPLFSPDGIFSEHGARIVDALIEALGANDDFVYIAGRWFPRALLVDVNVGNLNLAEAVLDMHSGGPLPTDELLKQVELPSTDNDRLAGFSLDLALQDDPRFDEVGSTGRVVWFLKRQEPTGVQKTPLTLRYSPVEYDRIMLSEEMLRLEESLDDELSPAGPRGREEIQAKEVEITLTYPHWRAGTLPISRRLESFFPSAYESPRILFDLIDDETDEEFRGWVVRLEKYVFGLEDWYARRGTMPGSILRLRRTDQPGRVFIKADTHRSAKEWVRTALVGADGGVVYATLKQSVGTAFDDRMMVYMPSAVEPLDMAWEHRAKTRPVLEEVVIDTMRELARLNPQAHVHVAELYSALNVVMRCPPGPLMAVLASSPQFTHVGDLHYRLGESREGRENS